jgi:hypothetical protein
MRMEAVAPISYAANSSPELTSDPNRYKYLDLAPQAAGIGAYVNPKTGNSEYGPYPADMTKRNAFRGPGKWNLDLLLSKRFSLTERAKLQLRLEGYNVLNHANYYIDGGTVDGGSGLFVAAYRTNHRNVQLGLKLIY